MKDESLFRRMMRRGLYGEKYDCMILEIAFENDNKFFNFVQENKETINKLRNKSEVLIEDDDETILRKIRYKKDIYISDNFRRLTEEDLCEDDTVVVSLHTLLVLIDNIEDMNYIAVEREVSK